MNKWKNLILTHSTKEILILFNTIFLGIYFFKITEGSVITVSVYYLIYYLFHIVWRYIVSKFIKPNRVIKIYRFSLFTNLIVSLILLISKESIVNYVYSFAIFYALSQCLYWTSYEIIIYDINNKENFNKYFTYDSVLYNITALIFPTIFGTIIENYSYSTVFIILFAITIISFIMSFTIKDVNISCSPIKLKESIKSIKNKKLFRLLGFQSICDGLTNGGVIQLLSTLILYNNLHSEGNVGFLSSIISFICIFLAIFAERKINYNNYPKIVLPIMFAMFFITIPISLKATTILIIIYQLLIAVGDVFTNIEGNAIVFNGLKNITTGDYKTDYFWFIELVLATGRAIGLIMIIIFANIFNNVNSLIVLFIFFSAFFVIRAFVIIRLHKCLS